MHPSSRTVSSDRPSAVFLNRNQEASKDPIAPGVYKGSMDGSGRVSRVLYGGIGA